MLEAPSLLAPLRRIRRRLRLLRALDGTIVGVAVGLLAAGLVTVWLHHTGRAAGPLATVGLALAGAAAGAILRGARPIPLAVCARKADAALDGQDRVLSALDLAGRPSAASRFTEALIADAGARLETLVPAVAVPRRRPQGFSGLAAAAAVAALAALTPVRTRAAAPPSRSQPLAAGPRLATGALDAEQDAARAAAQAADRLGNEALAKLAAELEQTFARLSAGGFDDSAALDALRSIAARADAAARSAERDRGALDAAADALAGQAATRAAAEALRAGGEGAANKAGAALGRGAEAHPAETSRALASAARALAGAAAGSDGGAAEQKRRLNRQDRDAPSSQGASGDGRRDPESERRLERLARDLDDAASACRDGAPSCRNQAESRARELAQLGERGAAAEALRRLERAAQQARARLGRGDLRQEEAGDGAGQQRFQRAARGEGEGTGESEGENDTGETGRTMRSAGGAEPSDGNPGAHGEASKAGERGPSKRGPVAAGAEGEGTGSQLGIAAPAAETSGGSNPGGDGIGHDPGGPPLGRAEVPGGRGRDTEAHVTDGVGPNRAQVIGVAAGRGFAAPGYARVFADYQAAVEDAMGATAVPEGKRYVVRRYFDLIRPRTSGGRR